MANERLLKFTGDLKGLPFRDLRTFADKFNELLVARHMYSPDVLMQLLVQTAEAINPDQDDIEGPRNAKRQGLAEKI